MTNLRPIEMDFLDDLFVMHEGFVLKFTDRTFSEFFEHELQINIDDPKFFARGSSKAKRLRYFLQTADTATVVKALQILWEYREAARQRAGVDDKVANASEQLGRIIQRLGGNWRESAVADQDSTSIVPSPEIVSQLNRQLIGLKDLDPQPRGYAFEKFLNRLFSEYGLEPREPFRMRGEQIDGSFQHDGQTYLLEARWRNSRADAAALMAFNGKLDEKAAWTRGLFVSHAGFSDDGLFAFGRGKRLVCMDGLDLHEMFERKLSFHKILAMKVRRTAETGIPFVRVRDLIPT